MITLSQLRVSLDEKNIISSVDLSFVSGSTHVLMGPNGSGKSTLAYALMGHPKYHTTGRIIMVDTEITALSITQRAQLGIFLAFQNPYELPGVTVYNFLKEACIALKGMPVSALDFQTVLYEALDFLELDHSFAHRYVNVGFSGGEKKRLELLQLLILRPQVAILDEIDSGLDVDGLKLIAKVISRVREHNPAFICLLITHYARVAHHVPIDAVHIMAQGKLVRSGDAQLLSLIDQAGYESVLSHAG